MKKLLLLILFPYLVFGQSPNYSEDIAPIIYNKCLQCHHNGGISPLSLETYAATVFNSGMIQHVTSNGEMPPWPPDTLFQNYSYENVLNTEEIIKITDWILNGSPLGDTSLLPDMPTFSNTSILGPADLELQIPNYSSNATSNSDDYVCFSIPTGLVQDKRVRAIEIIPGNTSIVHHVIVAIDSISNNTVTTSLNCMGPGGAFIYGYAPGGMPIVYPSGNGYDFGITLPAGSSISLGMHYPEGSYGMIDSTKVRFHFYPDNTNIRDITTGFLITNWSFILPPNQVTMVSDSFGPLPQDISLMSILPHMHLLGKDLECIAVTPMNDTINLVRINAWDFEWQGFYFFEKFLKIPTGSMIYAKANYDNTASVNNPSPILVTPGENTTDEMFVFGFQFLPYILGDENISIQTTLISSDIDDYSNIDHIDSKEVIQLLDILGRKIPRPVPNQPYFIFYDDGIIEKRIIIE